MRESQKVEGIRSIKSRCMTPIGDGVKEDINEIVYPLKSSDSRNLASADNTSKILLSQNLKK